MTDAQSTIDELVRDISGLITLPDVYLRIQRLLEDPTSSSADLAKAISQDAAFTIRLLKVANSSLYNFPSTVDTVAKAVTIIGTAQVRSLALSLTVAKQFNVLLNDLVSMENFWKHSLLCALASRHLGRKARRCDPDALFTAGLLHDIGELILFNRRPEASREVILKVLDSEDELPIYEAERQIFGFDHSAVGAALARQWQLPTVLQECIAHHHAIENAKQHKREVALVHLGNVLALMAEIDSLAFEDVEPIDPLAWEISGLDPSVAEPVVRAAQDELSEAMALFAPGS